jgi:hypothetical protein
MKVRTLGLLLAAFGLSSAALVGCSLFDPQPTKPPTWQAYKTPSPYGNKPQASPPIAIAQAKAVPGDSYTATMTNTSQKTLVQSPAQAIQAASNKTATTADVKMQPAVGQETVALANPDADSKPVFPRGEPTVPPRKSYSDITVHSSFGHAPDYSWVSGEVQQWRKDWCLRYAAVDEDDQHGGSVTLVGEEFLAKLKDGEHYKVQGRLVPAQSKIASPVFHIESLQPVGQ